MIFHLAVTGMGVRFSTGIGKSDFQTDGKWDPYKIGLHLLNRINHERGCDVVPMPIKRYDIIDELITARHNFDDLVARQ